MSEKAALYARVSTENQDLEKQIEKLTEFAEKNNHEYHMFKEKVSSVKKRPQFNKLMDNLEDYDFVAITKLDRLARTLNDLMNLVNDFQKNGVDLIVIKDNIDTTTPQGKLFFHMYGAFIEFERSVIIQRMQSGREYAVKYGSRSGKPCHRPKKEIDVKKLLQYRDQGVSLNKMQEIFGVSRQTIKTRLLENV